MKKYVWRLVLFAGSRQIQNEFISKCPVVGDTVVSGQFNSIDTLLLDFKYGDVFYSSDNALNNEAIAVPSGALVSSVFISDSPRKTRTDAALKRSFNTLLRPEIFYVRNHMGEILNTVQIMREKV